jgi:hypothetical protein
MHIQMKRREGMLTILNQAVKYQLQWLILTGKSLKRNNTYRFYCKKESTIIQPQKEATSLMAFLT